MTATQFPPLVCRSCNGTGRWDVGTEDEGSCRADYCQDGVLGCANCAYQEPAVGTARIWSTYGDCVEDIPLCRMHLRRANAAHAAEDRGDYERDMRKHGDL